MKRIVLAIALVVLFAVPAMAQNVEVTFNGDLIGTYFSGDGFPADEQFGLYSILDREYSNLSMTAKVGDNLAFTYRVGLDDFIDDAPYTREAYVSLLNVAPALSEIRVGEFTFPFAAQQWLGYHKGIFPASATGAGVMLSGSFAPINYNLAVTNEVDSLGWPSFLDTGEKPVWAKVSSDLGAVNAGLSYAKGKDLNAWGLNAAFDAGIVGVTAEYVVLQETGYDDVKLGFVGANVPVTGPLSVFAKYYLLDDGIDSLNAFAFGADYALSDNAKIRVENISDKDDIWTGDGLEAQLRVSF
ncbi:MAG: hypothetical protein ACOX1G_07795 [bacterium]|jgi:hypothetical protein